MCRAVSFLFFLFTVNLVAVAPKKESLLKQRDPFYWVQVGKHKITVEPKSESRCSWLVCGISLSEQRPCALLVGKNETKVVSVHEDLGHGWVVEKITGTSIHLKHSSGECEELWV